MPHEPHGSQVQHPWTTLAANQVHQGVGASQDLGRTRTVHGHVCRCQASATAHVLDPACGRRRADPPTVVLAHQEQRHRKSSARAVRHRIQRAHGRRVVDRRVTKARDDDGVPGPARGDADGDGSFVRKREPERTGQMRGDRGRLRNHRECGVAEHLVAATGDRIARGCNSTAQHVGDGRRPRHLLCTRGVEAAGPVVQQRRIRRSQRRRHGRVALVSRGADRVEALHPAAAASAGPGRGVGSGPVHRSKPSAVPRPPTGRPGPAVDRPRRRSPARR